MIRVNIFQAKAHLSEYLEQVQKGEKVVICKHNVPIAELHSLQKVSKKPRPVGLAKGLFEVSDRFFEPLPEDFIRLFEGNTP